jgi:hypothetical protein
MKHRPAAVRTGIATAAFVLASCSVGSAYRTPKPDVPDRFVASTRTAPRAASGGAVSPAVLDLANW